ncbi:type II toxin-antitoxin system TacA family antitoxin [Granulicella aggregans]|uniref:type II toxin-antitoxin system TacA family antitoxin n=1 Tax=Granulicella aggregans TaxID=474949 RepID=UPI0021E04C9B|nr:DUF1778 domain-containing protein [Granulicella aggregans]
MAVAESRTKNVSSRKARPAAKPAGKTRATLNMRIQPDLRILIDRAAEVAGQNRTDFVLDAARKAAQTTLLDQVHLQLSPAAFKAFIQRLDAPPQPNQRLRKSLETLAPWE